MDETRKKHRERGTKPRKEGDRSQTRKSVSTSETASRAKSESGVNRPPKPLPRYHSIQEPDTAPVTLSPSGLHHSGTSDHAPAAVRRPASRDERKRKSKKPDDEKRKQAHRSRTPRDESDLKRRHSSASSGGSRTKAKSGRNQFVQENRETHSRVGSSRNEDEDDASSVHSSESRKKLMLKYMLKEVREIKRSIDPTLPDIHVTPKRTRHQHLSEDDVTSFNDSQNLDGFEEYFDSNSCESFDGFSRSVSEQERREMMHALKTYTNLDHL